MKDEIIFEGCRNEREDLISIMIVKCGFNPELMIRKVEEYQEERIDYELGGISISRENGFIIARVDNYYIANKLIIYKWKYA